MRKANLWIINYCMLEIKADNKPVISLPVYFKSDKKWKFDLREKKDEKKRGANGKSRTRDHRRVE